MCNIYRKIKLLPIITCLQRQSLLCTSRQFPFEFMLTNWPSAGPFIVFTVKTHPFIFFSTICSSGPSNHNFYPSEYSANFEQITTKESLLTKIVDRELLC